MIKVKYLSVDRARVTRSFKTLAGARKFAQSWVGKHPEMGSTYAVSGDGIGKITAEGAKLADLFGDEPSATSPPDGPFQIYIVEGLGDRYFTSRAEAEGEVAIARAAGWPGPFIITEDTVTAQDFRSQP